MITLSKPSERRRVIISFVAGILAGSATAVISPWQSAVLVGWDVAAAVLLGWVWLAVARLDAPTTKLLATREDDSRAASRVVIVGASTASLIGVFVGIVKARQMNGRAEIALTVASLVAVILAWTAIHTVHMLRYAHLYYDTDRGIDFPGTADPTYLDFAYLAFTIGMTFQVSDTSISTRPMRALLLQHAALSYLFGTVIVGLTINVLGSFLG